MMSYYPQGNADYNTESPAKRLRDRDEKLQSLVGFVGFGFFVSLLFGAAVLGWLLSVAGPWPWERA